MVSIVQLDQILSTAQTLRCKDHNALLQRWGRESQTFFHCGPVCCLCRPAGWGQSHKAVLLEGFLNVEHERVQFHRDFC